ncbi:MAG: hypothetical protein HGJ93_18930 [Desulfosarcina sp.]|nr:hypothetical protein [Desulfosarcina sp.]MBC2767942.1 hypothetical protein [Desulfosarcina sp.]
MKRIPSIGGGLVLFLALLPAIPAMGAGTAALPNPPPEADAPLPDAPAPMTDIHDILPPVSVGIYAPWLVPVLLALAAAAILAVAWWFWKKYKKARIIETIIPELPPEMTAMQALDEISDVCRLGGKTFYFRLSAILRQYVFGRFAVGAPEMTTEEFVPCIDRLHIDNDLAHRLRSLCRTMDPVKFGGETAVEKQMETDLFFAREFVRKTTPTTDTENRTSGGEPPKVLLLI